MPAGPLHLISRWVAQTVELGEWPRCALADDELRIEANFGPAEQQSITLRGACGGGSWSPQELAVNQLLA